MSIHLISGQSAGRRCYPDATGAGLAPGGLAAGSVTPVRYPAAT